MLRHRMAHDVVTPARLVYSARTIGDVIYREELDRFEDAEGADVVLVLTRLSPRDGQVSTAASTPRSSSEVTWTPGESRRPMSAGQPASSRRWPTASSTSVTNRSRSETGAIRSHRLMRIHPHGN